MFIYFACSLTGGRQDESIYQVIVNHLLANRHQVPTAHLASPGVMELEQVAEAAEVFQRDVAWIGQAQAMIAEVSTPSHGVGFEIGYALGLGKPVLCCYQEGRMVSKMILGNDSPGLTVRAYKNEERAVQAIDEFLAQIGP